MIRKNASGLVGKGNVVHRVLITEIAGKPAHARTSCGKGAGLLSEQIITILPGATGVSCLRCF